MKLLWLCVGIAAATAVGQTAKFTPKVLPPSEVRRLALKQLDGPRCDRLDWPRKDVICGALESVAGQFFLQQAKKDSSLTTGGDVICIGSKAKDCPPPIDVPPITEEYGKPGRNFCDMGHCTFVEEEPLVQGILIAPVVPCPKDMVCLTPLKRRTRLTCADKTRFLMTAEDGSKHCIKLGGSR